jgi:hypothetical protein
MFVATSPVIHLPLPGARRLALYRATRASRRLGQPLLVSIAPATRMFSEALPHGARPVTVRRENT